MLQKGSIIRRMEPRNELRKVSGERPRLWLASGFAISTALALILAAHEVNRPPGATFLTIYVYWIVRLSAAFLLYAGAVLLLEATPLRRLAGWPACAGVAVLLSLVPFVMVVTMLDLAVGLPELDGAVGEGLTQGIFGQLVQETGYLADNHLFYCLIVTLPRVWDAIRADWASAHFDVPGPLAVAPAQSPQDGPAAPSAPAFLSHVQPSVVGQVRVVEAQEHYIRVQTSDGAGLALYRFGDALRELDGLPGLQVHRSYWVAEDAVAFVRKSRRGMSMVLGDGQEIPVSRRFEVTVAARFATYLQAEGIHPTRSVA